MRRRGLLLLALLALAAFLLWPHVVPEEPTDPVTRQAASSDPATPRLAGRAAPGKPEAAPAPGSPPGPGAPERPSRAWSGRVVDAAGEPVPGAWVMAQHTETRTCLNVRADDDGAWSLALPGEGPWRLLASAEGRGNADVPACPATIGTVALPDLVLRGEGVLAGRAVFPDDTPADRVLLSVELVEPTAEESPVPSPGLSTGTMQTDASGRFRVAGLRPGRYRITVPIRWVALEPVEATTDEPDLRLEIPRHRTRVQVLDGEGRPVPDSGVGVARREADGWQAWGAERAADGTLDLWLDPAWTWAVGARAHGHAAVEREVHVPEHAWSRTIRLELAPRERARGRLRIELVDEQGTPLDHDGAWIALPRSGLQVQTLPGTSQVPEAAAHRVPPGTWRLVVTPGGASPFTRRGYLRQLDALVDVTAGEETTARLVARPGGRLCVTVRLAEGAGLAGDVTVNASLRADGTDDLDAGAQVVFFPAPDEAFTTDVLDPGSWTVHATADDLESEVVRVEVIPGGTTDVELILRPR